MRFTSRVRQLAAAGVALLSGCSDLAVAPSARHAVVGPLAATPDIYDGARNGHPGFYWLPPMVPPPATAGTFDPSVKLRIVVSATSRNGVLVPVAEFTSDGPAGAKVYVEPKVQAYVATWRTTQCLTGPCRLEPNQTYQIAAYAVLNPTGDQVFLGFADAFLARRQEDLLNVDPSRYIGVLNGRSLSIRVRIEKGMVGRIAVQPAQVNLDVGKQVQLSATAYDVHGQPIAVPPIAWASWDTFTAAVSSTGLVTGVSSGATRVSAQYGALRSFVDVNVQGPSSDVPPTLVSPTSGVWILQNNAASGCAYDPVAGYGFTGVFTWTPAYSPRGVAYHRLIVEQPSTGKWIALVDVFLGTTVNLRMCGTRIEDQDLDGWQWRVRGIYWGFIEGPWSAPNTLAFLPADASSDFTLQPPNYGAGKTQVSVSGAVDAITSSDVRLQTRVRAPVTVLNPPGVEYFRSEDPQYDAFYRSLGPWTAFTVLDQGFQRFWNQWMVWDPALPVVPGPTGVVATVVDPFTGKRVISNRELVSVVP